MSFIKKYWILEITLGLIAVAGVGTGVYNYVSASELADPQDEEITLISEPAEPQVGLGETAVSAEDELDRDDEEPEDDAELDDEPDEEGEGEFEFDPLLVAAELIGLDVESLEEELSNGRSLADIAAENNLPVEQLVTELVERELAELNKLAESGGIDADEVEGLREEIPVWTPFWVQTPYPDPVAVVAQLIGVDTEEVWEALDGNQTIEQLVTSKNVEPQTAVQAIADAEMNYVRAMLDAGLIDEEELEEVKTEVNDLAQRIVTLPESQWENEEGDEEGEDD